MAVKTTHPGKTAAQRRALDAIGCGDFSPAMADRTRDALLVAGLIEPCGERILGRDRFGTIAVQEYQMPIHVHMQWCRAVASSEAGE